MPQFPKRKRYTYKEPYFIIDTDKGFLCYNIDYMYHKQDKSHLSYSLHTDECWKEYDTWYKHNYEDSKELWKPCHKSYFIYPHCLLKRKTKESLERMIENMKNGTIKHPERFPNPRIVEITDSFQKFVERRHSVGIAWNVDYNIWEW